MTAHLLVSHLYLLWQYSEVLTNDTTAFLQRGARAEYTIFCTIRSADWMECLRVQINLPHSDNQNL